MNALPRPLLLSFMLALAACAQQGTRPELTVRVGPSGGILRLAVDATRAQNGVAAGTLELQFPAGALAEETAFTLAALPADGDAAAFSVSPSNVELLAPVVVTFEAGAPLPVDMAFAWSEGGDSSPVGGELSGSRLRAELVLLGTGNELGTAAGALRSAAVGDGATAAELRIQRLACDAEVQALKVRIRDARPGAGSAASLSRLGTELKALKARCSGLLGQELAAAACERYAAVSADTAAAAITDEASFSRVVGVLFEATALVQLTGGECDISGFESLVEQKFGELVSYVQQALAASTPSPGMTGLLQGFRRLVTLEHSCQQLGLELCKQLEDEILPDYLDRLRQGAWSDCATSGDTSPGVLLLERAIAEGPSESVLFHGRYSVADLLGDLSRCGVSATASAVTLTGSGLLEQPGTTQLLGGGARPADYRPEATFQFPAGDMDGGVRMVSRVRELPCPPGSVSDEQLAVTVDGTELSRVSRVDGGFDLESQPLDVLFEAARTRAGLPADATAVELRVQRVGEGCDRYTLPLALFDLHLRRQPPPPRPVGHALLVEQLHSTTSRGYPVGGLPNAQRKEAQPTEYDFTASTAASGAEDGFSSQSSTSMTARATLVTPPAVPGAVEVSAFTSTQSTSATAASSDPNFGSSGSCSADARWRFRVVGAPMKYRFELKGLSGTGLVVAELCGSSSCAFSLDDDANVLQPTVREGILAANAEYLFSLETDSSAQAPPGGSAVQQAASTATLTLSPAP